MNRGRRRWLGGLTLALVLMPWLVSAGSINTASQVPVVPGTGIGNREAWTLYDAHWHEYDGFLCTNQSGSSTAVGDVLVVDAANDTAVTLDNTVSSRRQFAVAAAVIANTASGECVRSGIISAKSTGSIARGEYVRKSATSKAVETTGVTQASATRVPDAALGIALAAASGGFVKTLWFSRTVTTDPDVQGFVQFTSGASTTSTGTTQYIGNALSTDEENAEIPAPATGVLEALIVRIRTAPGSGASITATVRKSNNADTILTCTISGTTSRSCTDTTNTANVTQSTDRLVVKLEKTSSPSATLISATVRIRKSS